MTIIDVAATAAVLDDAGWITTGDLGWLGEDGNLRLVGRVAEMYIRGGYNVYPAEVEAVLGAMPAVAEVAVVGIPDPVLGEIGCRRGRPVAGATGPGARPTCGPSVGRAWPTTRPPTGLVLLDQSAR